MEPPSKEYLLFCRASEKEDAGDIRGAIRLYRKLATAGEVIAQSNLANLLDDKIKPGKPEEAIYWYKRAVRGGYYPAAWNLAMHYRNLGKLRWQMHWLRIAAKMGEPDAPKEIRKLERALARR
jgi:TPR repeat protein